MVAQRRETKSSLELQRSIGTVESGHDISKVLMLDGEVADLHE